MVVLICCYYVGGMTFHVVCRCCGDIVCLEVLCVQVFLLCDSVDCVSHCDVGVRGLLSVHYLGSFFAWPWYEFSIF